MIYFDNSATTGVDPDIAEFALDLMVNRYGNPSSLHHFGMDAYQNLMNARYQAARLIGSSTSCIYFTSGGTESNNIAIRGTALAHKAFGHHIITTAIEHSSVLACCQALEHEGFSVSYIKPNPLTHRIEISDILQAVRDDTILVSAMCVNNETGEILPIREIADGVHSRNPHARVHCDAVQAFGKIQVKLHELHVDLLSASGHKIHAPKGTGILYIREGCPVTPLKYGGAQESRINPGTENVPLSCAFGAAAEKRLLHFRKNLEYTVSLNAYCLDKLHEAFPSLQVNSPSGSSPYILNISVPGQKSGDLVDKLSMRDIYISVGSACSRGTLSHVLLACGYDTPVVESAIRISFCETNTPDEIDRFVSALKDICSVS